MHVPSKLSKPFEFLTLMIKKRIFMKIYTEFENKMLRSFVLEFVTAHAGVLGCLKVVLELKHWNLLCSVVFLLSNRIGQQGCT